MDERRNELIMVLEIRISHLIATMKKYKNIEVDGLPHRQHSLAYAEWRVLKRASTRLQEIACDEQND